MIFQRHSGIVKGQQHDGGEGIIADCKFAELIQMFPRKILQYRVFVVITCIEHHHRIMGKAVCSMDIRPEITDPESLVIWTDIVK